MKPSYAVSRRYLWWSFWFAWGVIILLVAGGLTGSEKVVDLADIVVPSMVFIVVCNLGVHRGFGSIDFWANAKNGRPTIRQNKQNEGWDE